MSSIIEFLWRLIPDKCQIKDCCRKGMRGNENIIDGKITCDYCHVDMLDKDPLPLEIRINHDN